MLIGALAGSGLRDYKTHPVHTEKMSRALNQMSSLVHRTASLSVLCQASALLHCPWEYFPLHLRRQLRILHILLCARIAFPSSLCITHCETSIAL